VSDAKVDMLVAQIPTKLRRRVASQLKIDLKIVSTTLTPTTPQESRYSKLELVESFLQEHAHLGSIDEPDTYFVGRLEMSWGPTFDGKLVYFGGATDRTVLGLAGSRRHVIGAPGTSQVPAGPTSATPDLIAVLRDADPATVGAVPPEQASDGQLGWSEAAAIARASTNMSGLRKTLEFLARRVALRRPDNPPEWVGGLIEGRTVVLGSPLFVAEVD
jgi:hypothetical protein